MAKGENSTLILHPTGRSDITFDQDLSESAQASMFVPAGTLRLNEEKRLEVVYGTPKGRRMADVRVAGWRWPSVPVVFDVVVNGTTRAEMMQKAHDLFAAVTNDEGGTLEFMPEDITARSTFYHYLKSSPPALVQDRANRWDGPVVSDKGTDVYRMIFEVELQTLPIATSDPDSPVSVVTGTVYNVGNGSADFLAAAAANVKGSLPALTRLTVVPGGTGASSVGRLWLAQKAPNTNLECSYLSSGSTYVNDSSVWSTVVDATRCGGSYVRCTPDQSGIEYGRRFTIANWANHVGRAAIALICRSNAWRPADWDVRAAWYVADQVLYGDVQHVNFTQEWGVLLLGEIDLPATEMSGLETLALYIDVLIKRNGGDSTFDIDAIKLLYTDQGAVQVDLPAGVGADSGDRILVENVSHEEIAHVINDSTLALERLCNAYGPFLCLEPLTDQNVDVLWERYKAADVDDDFSGYNVDWEQIADFGLDEAWTGGERYDILDDTWYAFVGRYAYKPTVAGGASSIALDGRWTLSDWASTDYITLACYVDENQSGTLNVTLTLYCLEDETAYFHYTWSSVATEENSLSARLTDFSEQGSPGPDWGGIFKVKITVAFSGGDSQYYNVWFDDLRAVRKDPDAAAPNDLGTTWDINDGQAHVAYDQDEGCYYAYGTDGQLTDAWDSGILYRTITPTDFRAWVKCWINSSVADTGILGLQFWYRLSDVTPTSVDGYCLYLQYNGAFFLGKSVAGALTYPAGGFVRRPLQFRQWFYLGLQVIGDDLSMFYSETLEDLFSAKSHLSSVTDSANPSGTMIGLDVRRGHMRWSDFHVEEIKDVHVPADSGTLTVYTLYRTIYPFYD